MALVAVDNLLPLAEQGDGSMRVEQALPLEGFLRHEEASSVRLFIDVVVSKPQLF